MSRVKSKGTAPELKVRKAAHALGLRFRLYRKDLPGKPDLVFSKHRLALFVHGCFWHRHPNCPKASTPKSRDSYWNDKFETNVLRDAKAASSLEQLGWRVEVIWECECRDPEKLREQIKEMFDLHDKT